MEYYLLVTSPFSSSKIESVTDGILGRHFWYKEIIVSLKEYIAVSRPNHECSQDVMKTNARCLSECFQRHYLTQSDCR